MTQGQQEQISVRLDLLIVFVVIFGLVGTVMAGLLITRWDFYTKAISPDQYITLISLHVNALIAPLYVAAGMKVIDYVGKAAKSFKAGN